MVDLPTLGLVISSALIDSINPCAIGVLILMEATTSAWRCIYFCYLRDLSCGWAGLGVLL